MRTNYFSFTYARIDPLVCTHTDFNVAGSWIIGDKWESVLCYCFYETAGHELRQYLFCRIIPFVSIIETIEHPP